MRVSWHVFREELVHLPVFSFNDIRKFFPGFDRKRLVEWKEKGYITGISRGFYTWPGAVGNEQDKWALACTVYAPACISLESALGYYGLIPEGVFSVTAITTHKTRVFSAGETEYYFRTIQPSLFFGYSVQRAPNGMPYSIAYPEKVLLDWLYLHPSVQDADFYDSLRWNKAGWLAIINAERLMTYKAAFKGHAFNLRFNNFQVWLHDGY